MRPQSISHSLMAVSMTHICCGGLRMSCHFVAWCRECCAAPWTGARRAAAAGRVPATDATRRNLARPRRRVLLRGRCAFAPGKHAAHLLPGEGSIDWPWVAEQLDQHQFAGGLIIEMAARDNESVHTTLDRSRRGTDFLAAVLEAQTGNR
jgi:hypothetical protein